MGGGDLNLKKSWHPQTIRNVEKVWKAEQKAEAEAKKIEQLRKELDEERAREDMQRHAVEQGITKKKGERLDWMYAAAGAGHVDHELYLLGKPVDKAVDSMAQDKEEDSSLPGASFMSDTGANSANDLAAKVRDDPLFLIKKKEEEKRKELINNPVKMKQLKLMLQANLEKSSKKKKKDRKKKSKEKREKKKKKRKERHIESSERSETEEEEMLKENQMRKHEEREKEACHGSHRNHRRDDQRSSEKRRDHRRSRSRSPSSKRDRERWKDRRHRHSSSDKHTLRSPPYSPSRKSRKQPSPSRNKSWNDRGSAVTRTMDATEKEKRLAAMMENAKWRDDQRGKNIKRYKEEDEELEARDTGDGEKSAKFLTDVKIQSFSSKSTSSVSDRIRRNINSVQRTPAALESFLAK